MWRQRKQLTQRSSAWRNHAPKPNGSHAKRTIPCRFSVIATLKRCMRWRIICLSVSTEVARPSRLRIFGSASEERLRYFQIRINLLGDLRFKSSPQSQQRNKCDHGGIIGTQPRLGTFEFDPVAAARVAHLVA